MMDTKIIKDVIDEMTEVANLDKDYANMFFERIIKDESLLNEFIHLEYWISYGIALVLSVNKPSIDSKHSSPSDVHGILSN